MLSLGRLQSLISHRICPFQGFVIVNKPNIPKFVYS